MSQFGAPLPKPVTESTAIEIQRKEGSARSWPACATITAGQILKLTNSGLTQTVGTEDPQDVFGIALFQGVSGSPTTVIKGRVRAFWDGTGTLVPGSEISLSLSGVGMVGANSAMSGVLTSVGFYSPFYGGGTVPSSSSGGLIPVELL